MVTRADLFPKPIRLMERSNTGKTIELLFSERFSFVPLDFRLLEELLVISLLEYSFNVVILSSENFTFIRALITSFLAVEWRVNSVLTYFINLMLASL